MRILREFRAERVKGSPLSFLIFRSRFARQPSRGVSGSASRANRACVGGLSSAADASARTPARESGEWERWTAASRLRGWWAGPWSNLASRCVRVALSVTSAADRRVLCMRHALGGGGRADRMLARGRACPRAATRFSSACPQPSPRTSLPIKCHSLIRLVCAAPCTRPSPHRE